MKVTGKITKVLDTQKGTSAAGKEWQKLSFILETTEDYNNLYCFDVFGDEKVEQFLKFNKVGQDVDVPFCVSNTFVIFPVTFIVIYIWLSIFSIR